MTNKVLIHISKYVDTYVQAEAETMGKHFRYPKLTVQLLFKTKLSKGGLTYRRQVVNPRHQTPQSHKVTDSPVEYLIW